LYLRRHDQAIRALEYALKLDPNRGQSYADLAFAQLMAGNPAECLRLLQQAREHVSFEPWSFGLFAGQCYLFLNRYEDAVRELRSSIARNPRFGDTRRILAVVYFEMGDIEDARAEAGEALRLLHGDFISRIDRLIPFKNQKDRERELSALRRLGYSE
jgi:adenylate cyclase